MKPALRFSVIVIFYNQRDFVRTAMDSVLSQTADGLEVIAVDDGSTDGTREVLSEYRDRARLVLLDQNLGASAARNAGTEVATGDYLAYLDGDDAFLPWAIDTYRRVAETQTPVLMMGPMHWFEGVLPEPGPPPEHVRYIQYDDYFAQERSRWYQCERDRSSPSCARIRRRVGRVPDGGPGPLVQARHSGPVRANHRAVHDVA